MKVTAGAGVSLAHALKLVVVGAWSGPSPEMANPRLCLVDQAEAHQRCMSADASVGLILQCGRCSEARPYKTRPSRRPMQMWQTDHTWNLDLVGVDEEVRAGL